MIERLLIANRGEIACRIMATAKRLGIHSVAVFSDADRDAPHAQMADECIRIGPSSATDSYLNIDRILEAAGKADVDAIHPGYGFLSENPAFAEACTTRGYLFVGPPAGAIECMGSKARARDIMRAAGVPVVPGHDDVPEDPAPASQVAEEIGYPVLLKPSAGGGGKGMKIVEEPSQLDDALASARREAVAAFADDRLIMERYLERPRHVEIQVFADQHGNTIHLFERDCSIQRRYQKIIEETPAPRYDDDLRAAMGATAVAAAGAVAYVGAGTVEFLLDADGQYYFMEMNTRLQVEHPVTEMLTGVDLVEWQLRIAAGDPLPLAQADLAPRGHAIEVRLYAEDPDNGFLPSTGKIAALSLPRASRTVRIDSGVREGSSIDVHYDPLLMKLICWGRTRQKALERLRRALAKTTIAGVTTNRDFLLRVVNLEAYRAGEVFTGFIDAHRQALTDRLPPPTELRLLALAAVSRLAPADTSRNDPWHRPTLFRLNQAASRNLYLQSRLGHHCIEVTCEEAARYSFRLANESVSGTVRFRGDRVTIDTARQVLEARIVPHGRGFTLFHGDHSLTFEDPDTSDVRETGFDGRLLAPMSGRIISLPATSGDDVLEGETLVILEAMKMEQAIVAPVDGTVSDVRVSVDDLVEEGRELLRIEEKVDT